MIERILLLAAISSLALAQDSAATTAFSSTSALDAVETGTPTTNAPLTHTVEVGLGAHTFKPDVTLANVGDVIEFDFFPTNHSVIRAEYLFPCVPYEMTGRSKKGFDSGFLPVDAILDDPPKYSITVNDSFPIFFYCGAPGSCINFQMVGVINPNASTSLQKHKEAAKNSDFMLLPGDKWPEESESTNPLHDDPSSSASGDSTPTSSAGAAATTTHVHEESSSLSTGAIAGIAVGGTLAVIAVAALIFFCGRASRRKNAANAAGQQQPLMQQGIPFSPGPQHQGHMSYIQPYGNDMNKHMSIQSHQMHSAALPGYIPPQGGDQTPGAQTPLYGPSDALNPGTTPADYTGSPQHSPHMGAVGMGAAPAYSQRNSMQPQPFSPGPHSPYQQQTSPYHGPATTMPGNNFHEMPGAPVPDSQYQQQMTPRQGGSELSGSDTLGRSSPPPGGQQGGGIMNFIKQNTGGK